MSRQDFSEWPYGRRFMTYVYHGDNVWFVSTATRNSSALTSDCVYDETMVWRSNDKHEREGYYLFMTSGNHFEVCRILSDCGTIEALEEWEAGDE